MADQHVSEAVQVKNEVALAELPKRARTVTLLGFASRQEERARRAEAALRRSRWWMVAIAVVGFGVGWFVGR